MSKFKKGFSLVELLVVIAIIGILAAVGITAYSGYTSSAKEIIDANRNEILAIAEQGAEHWDKLARNEAGSTYGRQKLKYTVKSGDVLGKIANTYNVRIADIRSWNNLRSNTIRIGQRLDIWIADGFYDEVNKSIEEYTNKSKVYKAENGYYKVQPGDTLWDISRKFEGLTAIIKSLCFRLHLQSNF